MQIQKSRRLGFFFVSSWDKESDLGCVVCTREKGDEVSPNPDQFLLASFALAD